MTKKFFSQIDKRKTIHLAPGVKVIKRKEFSTLQSAQDIIDEAKEEAAELEKSLKEAGEKAKKKSQELGFNEGLANWTDEIARCDAERKAECEELEKVLIPLAMKAAKKIVAREIELNKETIVDIISSSLRAVSHHRNVIIYVNRADLQILEENRPRLKQVLEEVDKLSVQQRDDVDSGGCIIETEGGIINAQLENLWRALENSFQALMKK